MFDDFWPDEVEEWADVAEALQIEGMLESMSAAQYGQSLASSDPEGKIADSRKNMVESLDDERRRLMGLETRTQILVSKTRTWIEQQKRQQENLDAGAQS